MKTPNDNDMPAPSTIKVGKASVGLIGLEPALNTVLSQNLPEDSAVDFLYEAVCRRNYVPDSAADLYREALRKEYRRRTGQESAEQGVLTIRVLGSGCVTCNTLSAMLYESLAKFNLAADMESVHDLDEIWRYGVTRVPALIINNTVKCAGRMPTQAEIEIWVKEEADRSR